VDEACQLLEQLQTNNNDDDNDNNDHHQTTTALDAMCNVVIAAYNKQSNMEGVRCVHHIQDSNITTKSSSSSPSVYHYYSFQGLTKVGKSKS
jgi:hypothetical protein